MGAAKRRRRDSHTRRRLLERYGIDVYGAPQDIAAMIRRGESTLLERQSWAKSIHEVEYRGVRVRVAYDNERHIICSALPREPR